MTERLKEEMLEKFRSRVNNATPLPWKVVKDEYVGNSGWVSEDIIDGITGEIYKYADAEFIAHAREDIPALLKEVEALEDELFVAKENAHQAQYDYLQMKGANGVMESEIERLRKNEVEYRRMLIRLRDNVLGSRSVYEEEMYTLLYGSRAK